MGNFELSPNHVLLSYTRWLVGEIKRVSDVIFQVVYDIDACTDLAYYVTAEAARGAVDSRWVYYIKGALKGHKTQHSGHKGQHLSS